MNKIILFALVFIFLSCKKNEEKTDPKILNKKIQNSPEIQDDEVQKSDTLKISYHEHKNLFDILTILPDSTMGSWEWKKNDRIEFVKQIQKNSYTTGSSNFSHIALAQPNTLEIQVVDGRWVLSIYKIKPNNYIVITDDIVGDGNQLLAFEYVNGELNYIPFKNLFDHFLTALVTDPNDEKCMESFEDNKIGFEYDFIGTKKITISNSLLKEPKGCFKGSTLNYEFNPMAKKFNLINIQ